MKRLFSNNFYRTLVFTITMLLQSVNLVAQNSICKKVTIRYIDFEVMTTVNVSCSDFNTAFTFNDNIQSLSITNIRDIERLVGILKNLKLDKNTKDIDTRVKIELFYQDYTEVICLDRFCVLRGSQIYKMNNRLFRFIEKQKNRNKT